MRLNAQDEKLLAERRQRARRRSKVRREQTADYLRNVASDVERDPQAALEHAPLLGVDWKGRAQPRADGGLDEGALLAGQPDIPPEVDDGPERCA